MIAGTHACDGRVGVWWLNRNRWQGLTCTMCLQDSTYSKLARVVKQVPSLPGKLLTCRHIVCMLVGLNVFMSLFALLLGQGQTSAVA
jgi:hypothetical protein